MSFGSSKGKQYGLIMPTKKSASKPLLKSSVFGDSSSDEENDGKRHVNISLKREHEKRAKQMQEAAAQALSEDPSIFEYDSVYDEMAEKKREKSVKAHKENKPKYIQALKKAAERRKLEGELVYEHQAQRELEKEANDFRDKESFLTSGYKKKLEERRVLEEELAKEAEFEAANDVTKQKDLSRFHKHLFAQVTSPGSETKDVDKLSHGREKESEHEKRKERKNSVEVGHRKERGWDREKRQSRGDNYSRKDYSQRRVSSDANQRESYRRHSKTQSGSESDDRTPSPLETSKGESDSLPASSVRKKTKLNAGIEVEVEEMEPTERRKIAAAKRSTQESMLSAKERFLARKRARLEMEAEKPAEDD